MNIYIYEYIDRFSHRGLNILFSITEDDLDMQIFYTCTDDYYREAYILIMIITIRNVPTIFWINRDINLGFPWNNNVIGLFVVEQI